MDLKKRDQSGFPVVRRLTNNSVFDGGPHWSPDGKKIVFGRMVEGRQQQQIWVMDLKNLKTLDPSEFPFARQLTDTLTSTQLFATWGEICADNGDDNGDDDDDDDDDDNEDN